MKGPWKVTSNSISGKTMYGVYRQVDVEGVDHSGNRENFGGYLAEREWAEALAEKLNKGGELIIGNY
ncbi:MAG: hypothetical protein HGA27_00390 [Peptococcaceae bacterium]|nr:hypothetical protein [Peptococcaceae bacterium]